ncbi:MAG: sulfatase [Cyclobacteriaceae bacterium]
MTIYRYSLFLAFCIVSFGVQAQKKNILLIVSDDLNTRIGPYLDIDKHTPNLDRLSAEGVKFTKAYCQYPVCGPSRASFMSGLYPQTNSVLSNSYKPGGYKGHNASLAHHPSLAGFFRDNGYFTARVSKIFHMGVPGDIERGTSGADDADSWDYAYNVMAPETLSPANLELLSPGNIHYGSNFSRMLLPDEMAPAQADYLAASQAIAILENRAGRIASNARNAQKIKPDSPFFLAVGFVRPHVPFIAPKSLFDAYPEGDMSLPDTVVADNVPKLALARQNQNIWKMNNSQKRKALSAYMASVRFMDEQVGRILKALDKLDIRKETIVIFLSDHGYNLGEHDCWSKVSLWEGSVRVPLIISHPDFKQTSGKEMRSVVELIDLYPTLTELCHLSEKQPGILQGKSLAGLLSGSQKDDLEYCAYTVTSGGSAASIRTARWRYSLWGEDQVSANEELYDHMNDPTESTNLADDPSKLIQLKIMRKKMMDIKSKATGH